ncbi:hypothetical protein [Xylella fastidiosa]|uniref:hypothetical protein n=1 Tax=Xylella fastidiosa TaxID=2371 RepID=UPI003D012ACC
MTATTASETKKAPLFCRDGIRDEEGAELQEVLYFESLDFTYPDPKGRCTVAIIEPLSGKFSPLVCSWFENGPQSDIKKWVIRFSDVERRINVGPKHPLYPQVKAAYEAQEAHSNSVFGAAKKWKHNTGEEVAACAATTASETKKAPLFYLNGIRDEEGAVLQPAIYSLVSPRDPNSAIKVSCLDRPLPLFSDLVCRCFVVRFDSEDRSCHYFIVDSSHPQYEQVRKAYSDRVWSLPSINEIKAMAKATGSEEAAA